MESVNHHHRSNQLVAVVVVGMESVNHHHRSNQVLAVVVVGMELLNHHHRGNQLVAVGVEGNPRQRIYSGVLWRWHTDHLCYYILHNHYPQIDPFFFADP